jgi:hypothetical protein
MIMTNSFHIQVKEASSSHKNKHINKEDAKYIVYSKNHEIIRKKYLYLNFHYMLKLKQ